MNVNKFIEDVNNIENDANKFISFSRDNGFPTTILWGGCKMRITKGDVTNLYGKVYCLNVNDVTVLFDKYKILERRANNENENFKGNFRRNFRYFNFFCNSEKPLFSGGVALFVGCFLRKTKSVHTYTRVIC